MQQTRPVTLFLSYAREDEPFCQELEKHLSLLQRQHIISAWYDRRIPAGTDRIQEINEQFERASMILLLISADFLASDYCYGQEMMRALQRHAVGKAQVVPILVRACDWGSAPFAKFQVLPTNVRPISTWPDQDEAWTNVVTTLRLALAGQPVFSKGAALAMFDPTSPLSHIHPQSLSTLEQQNRARFLTKLHDRYREILNYSLQGAAQIALELHSKPDAVINSTRLRLRQPNIPEHPLPAETTLLQVFDRTSGELLILGNPGAGKTTLLLTLAEALYERARLDEGALIPVIVNLSTWATARKLLAEWLIEEIMESYKLPRKPVIHWVEQNQILPLLDGLDEIEATALPVCIEAINTYKQQHLVPLVVCCRSEKYQAQQHRLVLQNAVVIQPLEEDQVDDYFKAAGPSLEGIYSVLRKNVELRELMRTPLLLRVAKQTYQGVPLDALPKKGTMQELQQQIFHQYIERMLALPNARFSSQSMRQWLSWLANQMRQRNQTVFYMEHLQPDWLSVSQQRFYDYVAVRLPAILIGVLISILVQISFNAPVAPLDLLQCASLGGFLGWLWSTSTIAQKAQPPQTKQLYHSWRNRLAVSISLGLLMGLSFGYEVGVLFYRLSNWWIVALVFGGGIGLNGFLLQFVFARRPGTLITLSVSSKHRRRWLHDLFQATLVRHSLLIGVTIGLNIALGTGLAVGLSQVDQDFYSGVLASGLHDGLREGLTGGLQYGFTSILVSLTVGALARGIFLTERLKWTLGSVIKSLFAADHLRRTVFLIFALLLFIGLRQVLSIGLSDGVGMGLSIGGSDGIDEGWRYGVNFGLCTGLGMGAINGLIQGLSLGLSLGLSYWLLRGLQQGIIQEQIEDQDRRVTNQGIHHTLRNSILMGILSIGVVGCVGIINIELRNVLDKLISDQGFNLSIRLFYWLSHYLSLWLHTNSLYLETKAGEGGQNSVLTEGLSKIPLITICGGCFVWLIYGGVTILRHMVIRLLLNHARIFPWKAPHFLDDATTRILLRPVGGGYSFTHRLLLDHFADLDAKVPSASADAPPTSSLSPE